MTMAGVVLAGGKSSRYGKPKMFELYEGKCLYEYSLDALREHSLHPLIISTNPDLLPKFKQVDVRFVIEEEQNYQGPLFALHHIMSSVPDSEWFFVLASDLPFMTSAFVETMISLTEDQYDAIVPTQSNRIQPLTALYHRRSLDKAQLLLQNNKKSMRALLDQLTVRYVPFANDQQEFININSKEDWPKEIK
ncbi:molybdenum cofactor guanylyltransferase [Bacillus sp. FJAT-42315]|uniref:molybdenum cofactor guanylyltransferase n=1 Tax=Bacillus sp. FJAT-42315 TaxID=2014077 RepID=UPI000C23FB0E|nr:molybdenum cofactor guanylyltransferase [Bacillus sp. FJAT-42315]